MSDLIVVRDRNGKVHVKQAVNLVGLEAASGGAFGAMWEPSSGSCCSTRWPAC
jgi:uncharacterized membrane protein